MEEKTVRKIMVKYFESKGIKPRVQRGAGPDLIIDGKAVEVKGSRINFARMLRQLTDYAYKYVEVSLALPFDGLTTEEADKLAVLAELIEDARDIRIKVYVVAPDPQGNKNLFYVMECKEATFVAATLGNIVTTELGFDVDNPDSTIHNAVEQLITFSFIDKLKERACYERSREVSKVRI